MAFRDLVKQQRQSGSGIVSSVGSAVGSSVKESMDIRNYLFKSGSLLNTLFPNVKGFKPSNAGSKSKTSPTSILSSGSSLSDSKLDAISQNTQIAAKNSNILPSMARDMNVMRQNIIKLVKLSGGTAATRADMFFLKSKDRENLYESQFTKSSSETSPTKAEGAASNKLGLKDILSIFGVLFSAGTSLATNSLKVASSLLDKILTALALAAAALTGRAVPVPGRTPPSSRTPPGAPGPSNGKRGSPPQRAPGAPPPTPVPDDGKGKGKGRPAGRGTQRKGKAGGGKGKVGGPPSRAPSTSTTPSQLPQQSTRWARFLVFLESRSPKLATILATRAAAAAGLATIPIVGWITVAVGIVSSVPLAWELYGLWKEFNAMEGEDIGEDTDAPPMPTTPTPAGGDYASQIAARESGGHYDTVFGQSGGAMINGKLVTENTIGEVAAWQATHRNNKTNRQAAGKYQFMDVIAAAKLAGLRPGDLFDAENQDRMMEAYTESNAKQLRSLNLPDTPEYLSMAHAVGAGGTKKLIDAQNAGRGNENSLNVLGLQGQAAKTNPQLNTTVDKTIASLKSIGPTGHGTSSASLAAPSNSRGTSLNMGSVAVADARTSMGSSAPVVINAPQNNIQNSSRSNRPTGNLPSVVDTDFMRHLVAQLVT